MSFYGYFVFFTKSILIIQHINDNNNRCYQKHINGIAKCFFIGKTSDTSIWTVEAYQWGIEGHHYPHTDNGPPQGQPGHWGKQNKRRNQYYTIQIVWTKTLCFSFWIFKLILWQLRRQWFYIALYPLIILLNIHVCETFTHDLYYSITGILWELFIYNYLISTNQKKMKYIVDTLIRIILSIPINSFNVSIPQ